MTAILILLLGLAWSAGIASSAERPNVLLILADDLGYSDLGCYGGEIETPQLDKLAKNGLSFTQFYNTARCWPTRGSLLTGYYAQQIHRDALPGLDGGSRGARQKWARLLPDLLKPLGYRSYHSGKWHIDGKPLAGGFDHSYLLQDQGRFFSPNVHFEDDVKLPTPKPDSGYYATTTIADHAIKCLQEHAKDHAGIPFFHYLAFTAPHFPLHALPEDIARYAARYKAGWDSLRSERFQRMKKIGLVRGEMSGLERDVGPPYHFPEAMAKLGSGEVNRPLPWSELTGEQRDFQAAKMAIHAAMVDRMDREIGRVLDQLRSMDAFDNTLILFASDNGASAEIMVRDDGHDPKAAPGSAATHLCLGPGFSSAANTPFRRHKTWVHEGGISTPLIAHWPQGIAARGELRHAPSHLIDVVPTILDIAGAKKPAEWEGEPIPSAPGKSLAPAFTKDTPVPRDSLWWLHEGNRAIRVGDWKLVAAKDKPWELYDLAADRAESNNLAEKLPEKVRELDRLWNAQTDEFKALAAKTALAPAPAPAKRAQRQPNVIFMLADDLGQRDLGSYGSTFYETPHLDRLAREGARFTSACAACPVCSPTRASIMTGRWPQRTGITDYIGAVAPEKWLRNTKLLPAAYKDRLAHEEVTLAEAMKAAGYATFFGGKWHLGPEGWWPENQGFEINKGGIERGGPYGGNKYFSPYGNPRLEDGPPGEHLPDRLATETTKFIEANKDRPFFAYLAFYDVHIPLMAREDLKEKYEAKRKRLGQEVKWGREHERDVRLVQDHAVYAGMVEAMDLAVGKVLSKLDELGLAENTLIVFTSDNGGVSTSEGWPTSNVPLRAGKGWLYEGGLRTPLLVRWPRLVKGGIEIDAPVSSPDFFPTLLEAAATESDQPRDGVSLVELLQGKELSVRPLYWHYPHYGDQGGAPGGAIREGDFKLIHWYEDDRQELYNLREDLGEQHDLAAKMPERVKALADKLAAWRKDVNAVMPTPNPKHDPKRPSGRAGARNTAQ